jgi:hypothetical protein
MCTSCRKASGLCTECVQRELPNGSGRAAQAVAMLRLILATEVVSTVLAALRYSSPSSQELRTVEALVAIVRLGLMAVTTVIFLRWWHLAARYALARGAALDASPSLAVGVWFIPIVNLFRPRRLADAMASVVDGGASAPIDTWWTLWVLWNVAGQISMRLPMNGVTSPSVHLIDVVRGLAGGAAAWFGAQVVQVLQAGFSRPRKAS